MALASAFALLAGSAAMARPAPAAEPPICTTVTTVVKKGEVVLSTSTRTSCERPKGEAPRSGEGLKAPEAVLEAPKSALSALFSGTDELKPRQVRGDWRTASPRPDRVCHLLLMQEIAAVGRKAKSTDCGHPLSRVAGWKLEDNTVGLYAADGALIVRLSGDATRLSGPGVTLER